jgi:hypothetical protein
MGPWDYDPCLGDREGPTRAPRARVAAAESSVARAFEDGVRPGFERYFEPALERQRWRRLRPGRERPGRVRDPFVARIEVRLVGGVGLERSGGHPHERWSTSKRPELDRDVGPSFRQGENWGERVDGGPVRILFQLDDDRRVARRRCPGRCSLLDDVIGSWRHAAREGSPATQRLRPQNQPQQVKAKLPHGLASSSFCAKRAARPAL